MGKRGPAPKPKALLQLHGSPTAKYGRQQEPEPETGVPRCPHALDSEARKIWKQLTPLLRDMGVLTRVDGNALVRYCTMMARWWELTAYVAEHGPTYQRGSEATGFSEGARPQMNLVDQLEGRLLRLEQQFGLTPSARAGLVVNPTHKQNKSPQSKYFA